MSTRSQQTNPGRWLLPFLAALVGVLAVIGLAGTASANERGVSQNGVGAISRAVEVLVEPPQHETAGQHPGRAEDSAETAVATGVAANTADTVVLGHYPEYVDLAKATGGRTFQIPTKIWDSMSSTEQWAANQKFLDRAIARGSDIRLATAANAAREGSYFERELQYMQSRGYMVGSDGMSLIAPGGP